MEKIKMQDGTIQEVETDKIVEWCNDSNKVDCFLNEVDEVNQIVEITLTNGNNLKASKNEMGVYSFDL